MLTSKHVFEITDECGACMDCHRSAKSDAEVKATTHIVHSGADQATSNSEHITVHCIEASHSSYLRLLRIRDSLPVAHASAQWRVHNIAMTKESGEVMFTTDCGTELCHIEVSGEGRKVKAYSVDDFVRDEGIQDIAILKIDTEGFDPDVISGALVTLEQGKADIVTFEYHGIGLWVETSLQSVVASLEVSGYACYLDGSPTLTRLDAQCWHADYEFKSWSNVVCARKSLKELYTAFERLSFRAAHFMHRAAL